jgi:hypothetical protein
MDVVNDDTPDPPAVHCRHLLICRTLWYDPSKTDEEYSLGRLVVSLRPPTGSGGRFIVPRLFAFAQLYGEADDYDVMVRLVRLNEDDEQELFEWGPWPSPVIGLDLVESHGFLLENVPFDGPGVYEFRLHLADTDALLAGEQVAVPPTEDML